MIYFLVNNDYQLFDARRHAKEMQMRGFGCTLLEVPHALHSQDRMNGFVATLSFPSPLTSNGWLGSWPRYFNSSRQVHRALQPKSTDTLIFFTEFELLNQFIVHHFRRNRARVYLLEDGGVGTYVPFSISDREPLNAKEWLIAAMTRLLPCLSHTVFHKINGQVFPWLPDRLIDAVCLYRPVKTVRKIPTILIQPKQSQPINVMQGKVIFLNQPLYDCYVKEESYLASLDSILAALSKGFKEVFFKFHPRESEPWTGRILGLLREKHPSVQLVEDPRGIEELLAELKPEVLAAYATTTLLNLEGTGVEPLYLYHLFKDLADQKIFQQLTTLLSQWNYNFLPSLEGARSGFRGGLDACKINERMSLCDLVTRPQ